MLLVRPLAEMTAHPKLPRAAQIKLTPDPFDVTLSTLSAASIHHTAAPKIFKLTFMRGSRK